MKTLRPLGFFFLLCVAGLLSRPFVANSQTATVNAITERNGQHDFDPLIGTWKYHLKRRLHPLTGSTTWVEFYGTGVCHKVWDGRADLDELQVDSPGGHIEGLTLRTYNPQTRQWSLYWANSKDGNMSLEPQIGEFKNGRGEFFGHDTLNGKFILVRYAWSNMASNSPHFEQSFSNDGGKTWEVNWITDQTRVNDESDKAKQAPTAAQTGLVAAKTTAAERDGQHDFDPLIGGSKFHLKRRLNPLTGSTNWVEYDGTGVCFKLWDGRANLDQVELDGPTGHIEGLTLRLYNRETHQWSLYWANSKDGKVVVPQIGEFKNSRGEFYAQDTLNDRSILVRFDWTNMSTSTPHFEQSFSDDGGKTWEVNWITNQTRVPD